MKSEEKRLWARILGENYRYRRGSRIRLLKPYRTHWHRLPKGSVYKVDKDRGKTVDVWLQFELIEIPKKIVEPCPKQPIKVGDRVKVLKTIACQGECASGRLAVSFIRKGRIGRVKEVEPIGTFHKLIHVVFRGGDNAIYEDWEVTRVPRRGRSNQSVNSE